MPVGTELPTRPPYGAAVATWAGPEAARPWLADVPADTRAHYRRALDAAAGGVTSSASTCFRTCACRSWRPSFGPPSVGSLRLGELAQAVDRRADAPGGLVPGGHRSGASYDVSHLDAPIFDGSGRLVLVLGLVPVPSSISGATISRLGSLLRDATARLTAAFGTSAPPAAG